MRLLVVRVISRVESQALDEPYVVLCRSRRHPLELLTVSGPYPDALAALAAATAEQAAELHWSRGINDLLFEVAPLHTDSTLPAG